MRWIFRLCTLAYVAALGFYFGEAMGWFGAGEEKVAEDVIRWLGLPWNLYTRGGDASIEQIVDLLAPAVNLGIVWLVTDLVDSRED